MAVKKWRGKWVVDLKIDGKRVRRVSPEQTRRGAQRYEAELLLGLSTETPCSGDDRAGPRGSGAPRACPTLAEFAPEWLMTYAVVNNKPSERLRKESVLRCHLVPFFGNQRLDEITLLRVEGFKAHLLREGLKASTINVLLATLRKLLNCAVEWGRLAQAPRIRKLPEAQADFDWLRPAESEQLLAAARAVDDQWYMVILTALRTGMRKGELIALQWSAVDLDRRRITVKYTSSLGQLGSPKSGRQRTIPMSPDLHAALAAWRPRSPGRYVFPGRDDEMMPKDAPYTALQRVLRCADMRHIRFHDLRHTFASHLVLHRRSLREVQLLLGHHSVTVTQRYAHVSDDQLTDAVACLGAPVRGERGAER